MFCYLSMFMSWSGLKVQFYVGKKKNKSKTLDGGNNNQVVQIVGYPYVVFIRCSCVKNVMKN